MNTNTNTLPIEPRFIPGNDIAMYKKDIYKYKTYIYLVNYCPFIKLVNLRHTWEMATASRYGALPLLPVPPPH